MHGGVVWCSQKWIVIVTHSQSQFQFSLLLGEAIYDGLYFGTGVRGGTTLGPGVYLGFVVINHFTDYVSVSYLGGELGYQARADKVSIMPYASIGTGCGGGGSAFYVAPAFALYVWPNANLGIGPDMKYVYGPEIEDGFGAFYLDMMYGS